MDKSDRHQKIFLKDGHYVTWVTAIEAELKHIGCWKFVDGTNSVVTKEKREKSYCIIMRHLDESIVAFVGNKIAQEEKGDRWALWRMLKDKFVGSGVQAQDLQTTTRQMALTGTDINNALVSSIRLDKPLEEISVDLMGPITPESLGGAKYILVVVDSNSCFSWVIMLKNKGDAKHELEKIISQAETALETQVKNIICDGGKEFVNSFIKDFCDSRGIQITVTTPYTPQHNGIAERTNRTLMDKFRTLIIESGIPKELWEELTNTAKFLRVRVSDCGKSPFEKLFYRKQNLSRMRRFGCCTFVTNNNYKHKLDKRAYKAILIGYEPSFGAYQILLEDTGKIICSHDVRFNEDELPLKMHKNQELKEQENTVEEEIEPISEEQEAPVL
ncbi:hypothetical protein O181_107044 [Austropuccinia psidii MF-1]|uniref:Integrase catalytic domain-containing protein n=1 Tax=Austropuccinia psidii MF-1 TaxID=1389203 RepID=A0A9Q3JSF6_9BASI|nr:hypothetical protein [Austropuccinia psidii MF-1]